MFAMSAMLMSNSGCSSADSDSKIQKNQEKVLSQINDQLGLPGIINYQEKKNLKMIYELRDQEKMICYAYLWNEFNGKLIFFGKCLGYGIPYATQYSSSMKLTKGTYDDGTKPSTGTADIAVPQAEPNGLFMPADAEGTWLMMLDDKGEPHPVYCEPRVIVSPFPLLPEQKAEAIANQKDSIPKK